jgi:hypothetical protein
VNLKNILSGLIFIALMISGTISHSQAKYNFEVGFSYCMASAEYKTRSSFFNANTGVFTDSAKSEKITSKGGFGGLIGHHFPIIRMGDYSSVSISISYMYDALFWEPAGTTTTYDGQGTYTISPSVTSGTIKMGLPIGVDYKFGCDAVSDKSRKLCGTFGAGVYPSLLMTAFKDDAEMGFRTQPYLKGEIGIMAGICVKLRGTFTFGKLKYIDYSSDYDNYKSSTSLTGKSSLTLSLIFMPMSFKWKKNEWWGK